MAAEIKLRQMKTVKNYFDYIDLTECFFEKFIWQAEIDNLAAFIEQKIAAEPGNGLRRGQNTFDSSAKRLLVTAENVGIIPGHPLNATEREVFWPKCAAYFEGVKKSSLKISEYVEEPGGSSTYSLHPDRQRKTIEDSFPFDEPVTLFELEGVFKHPPGWVEWEIESMSFSLQVEERDGDRVSTASEYSKGAVGSISVL